LSGQTFITHDAAPSPKRTVQIAIEKSGGAAAFFLSVI
jgi:hypothetical protein